MKDVFIPDWNQIKPLEPQSVFKLKGFKLMAFPWRPEAERKRPDGPHQLRDAASPPPLSVLTDSSRPR